VEEALSRCLGKIYRYRLRGERVPMAIRWHDLIGVPTLADAILDRVIHNAVASDVRAEGRLAPPSARQGRG
jgi:hypothetical protein